MNSIKKKYILTISFIISFLPMLLSQYGGMKGVQEIFFIITIIFSIIFIKHQLKRRKKMSK